MRDGLHWDVHNLFGEIKTGMRLCREKSGSSPLSLGVDTWGVDFGLLGGDGQLLGLPFSYRDERTRGTMELFFKRLPRENIYRLTGIQFLPLNTLFQMFSMVRDRSPQLDQAAGVLFMPDLFHYFLTGLKATEFSMATTSQLFDPRCMTWSEDIFAALGLPARWMRRPVEPGTVIGPLLDRVAHETGFFGCLVVASLTHDTAAAVAAVPAEGKDWAYISSGTWSLVGMEADNPVITDRSLELNFTNEGGIGRTIRLLKNVTGLWLLSRCRAAWAITSQGAVPGYDELIRLAGEAPAFRTFIDPDAPEFADPADMPGAIEAFARKTFQPIPENPGAIVRCILESLAFKYRCVLAELESLLGRSVGTVHIIGGGSRNSLLNRFTAAACGRPVVAGPAEASSCGNILGQALALGYIRSPSEARDIMRNSVPTSLFPPEKHNEWQGAWPHFLEAIGGTHRP